MGRRRCAERADLRAVTSEADTVVSARYRRFAASTAAVLRKAEVEAQELLAALHCVAVGASWKLLQTSEWPSRPSRRRSVGFARSVGPCGLAARDGSSTRGGLVGVDAAAGVVGCRAAGAAFR
jgi:hypothetical protein